MNGVVTTSEEGRRVARLTWFGVSAQTDADGAVHVTIREKGRVHELSGRPVVEIEDVADGDGLRSRFALRINDAQTSARVVPEVSWWTVDHHDSDSSYHQYCAVCYAQIPKFLVRYASPADAQPGDSCEGCGIDG